MTERAALLEELAEEIRRCRLCPLAQSRTYAVPGEGPATARVMLIGEGPGEQEDRTGRPFVGPAGQLLNELLARAGLHRREVFITNIVKCRPPRNREPHPSEVEACRPYLSAQIALLNPRVICLLGRPATHALLSPTAAISKIHGVPQEKDGLVFVPLYHPAAALHQAQLRPILEQDMDRLREFLRSQI